MPKPLQGGWQRMELDSWIAVNGVQRVNELVRVTFLRQDLGHSLVGEDPIVHVVAHRVGIKEILIADVKPDPQRLNGRVGDQSLVELPSSVRVSGFDGHC